MILQIIQMLSKAKICGLVPSRQIQLQLAQQCFKQLQQKLTQRFQCIQLQSKNINLLTSVKNQQFQYIFQKINSQTQQLKAQKSQLQIQGTQYLLAKQTKLEQQAQRNNILRQYQQRIYEMDCNLYTKEVDISVDHVGKIEKQKPFLNRVKQFNNANVEFLNVEGLFHVMATTKNMIDNISKESIKGLNRIQVDGQNDVGLRQRQKSKYRSKTETSINTRQIQKEQKLQSAITKQSEGSSQSNPQKQQKLAKSKRNKKLLLSSQKQIYQSSNNIHCDPQLVKMVNLINREKQRQNRLKNQYMNLKSKHKDLCTQNLGLVDRYKKIQKNKPNKDKKNQNDQS